MKHRKTIIALAVSLAAIGALIALLVAGDAPPTREYADLAQAVTNASTHRGDPRTTIATDSQHQTVVNPTEAIWYDGTGARYRTDIASLTELTRLFDERGFFNYREDVSPSRVSTVLQLLPTLIFLGLLVFLLRYLRNSMPGLGLGRSRARVHAGDDLPDVTFADVAGVDEAVVELAETVAVLRQPDKFAAMGARVPRGVLLYGPPGTGKTLLARAVAGEANVPFFSLSASEFVEMYVGVGAARVRDLFAEARKRAPAIVFIDEIDAVGRRRGGTSGHANDEREQTLNQLLVEMDGFDGAAPVIVMAATNRPDVLDPALLRPGRFDRRITVDSPDLSGRSAILAVHARNKPMDAAVDLHVVARQTPGLSGAELANVLNEAALLSARRDGKTIGLADLEEAALRVQAGPERANRLLSDAELAIIAHHEMGHALVGHVLPGSDPVHRISIVSRGRALGWTMQLPERDRVLSRRNQLTDQLAGLLAGRCAEELLLGPDDITSGAADDIARATALAHRMVTELGMSPLGLRAFSIGEPGQPRPHSEELTAAIDAEVDRLLDEAAQRAREVLLDRREVLECLAARLLEVETMDAAEMVEIIGRFPRAGIPPIRMLPRRASAQPSSSAIARGGRAHVEPSALHPRRTAPAPRWQMPSIRRTTAAFLRIAGLTSR